MPYKLRKQGNHYLVISPNHRWKHKTKAKALAQLRLLRMKERKK